MVIIIILFLVAILFIPVVRCMVLNFPKYIIHKFISLCDYLYYKEYNSPPFVGMDIIAGNSSKPMGSGKTLYAANYVQNIYNKYNNKKQKNRETGELFTNKIIVMSNIKLYDIDDYIDFKSFEQVKQFVELKNKLEEENPNIKYYLYVLIDEASIFLNSSKYKDKDNPITVETLNDLCQVRHNQIQSILFTSQRFEMCNINARRLSSFVKTCRLVDLPLLNKKRFLIVKWYISRDLEEATSELMIKPIKTECFYINNKKGFRYGSYDTHQMAGKILQKIEEKDYLSDEDLSKSIENNNRTGLNTLRQTRKYKKSKK